MTRAVPHATTPANRALTDALINALPPATPRRTTGTTEMTGPTVCSPCGTAPGDLSAARLTWTFCVERGRTTWTCVDCSRRHLRSIEAKLDSDWW